MFKCDNCKKSFRQPHRVVAETRVKIYENVYPKKSKKFMSFTKGQQGLNELQFARGTEIVKELNLCDKCFKDLGYDVKK